MIIPSLVKNKKKKKNRTKIEHKKTSQSLADRVQNMRYLKPAVLTVFLVIIREIGKPTCGHSHCVWIVLKQTFHAHIEAKMILKEMISRRFHLH